MSNQLVLYHYTAAANLGFILVDRKLRCGQMVSLDHKVDPRGAVNLTTDNQGIGHGLPDGRKLTQQQVKSAGASQCCVVNGETRWNNHIECRLKFEVDSSDPMLIKVSDYYRSDPRLFIGLQIGAILLPDANPPQGDINREHANLANPALAPYGKGHTWYYYRADLPLKGAELSTLDRTTNQYLPYP